jgi:hypothetical protein
MNRRHFLFRSLSAAALLSPVLSGRRALAQAGAAPKRLVIWVNCGGYPSADAFFPTGTETNFQLSTMLSALEPLKNDLVVVDNVNIRRSGLNPRGNEHLRSMGKVLTAKDLRPSASNPDNEGEAGGPSVDQLIARQLGASSLELLVADRFRDSMREQPFATGPDQFKAPLVEPAQAWDRLFRTFQPPMGENPTTRAQRLRQLNLKKSLLDGTLDDLSRFRRELVGLERLKLDIHEDSIRRAERSVQADLAAVPPPSSCRVPPNAFPDGSMPGRGRAHLDLTFAALACDRVQVAGVVWGSSGYHWRYEWAGVQVDSTIHDEVHHLPGQRRDDYIRAHRWDWGQLGAFVQRLKDTPEGDGTMLDNTLVLGISHFGEHHDLDRIPVVLFGNAKGRLRTGRFVRAPAGSHNDRLLTSVAHLMGVPLPGLGDDPSCGVLPGLV